MFAKATKRKQKARLAITGPAKAGKTRTALSIAKYLGKTVAVIDTERGSASKYAGDDFAPEFDTAELRTFSPAEYRKAMREASAYDVLVIDSLSHAWMGEGGILDQKDRSTNKSSFDAWRTLTPQHNELVDALLGFPGHLIVTMRVKTEYVLETDSRGKQVPRRVGLAPVQRDGIEYEFDVLAEMDHDHSLHVPSSRCSDLDGVTIRRPTGEEIARTLLAWLDDGAAPLTTEERLRAISSKDALHEFLRTGRGTLDRATAEPWVRECAARVGADVEKAVAFCWPAA